MPYRIVDWIWDPAETQASQQEIGLERARLEAFERMRSAPPSTPQTQAESTTVGLTSQQYQSLLMRCPFPTYSGQSPVTVVGTNYRDDPTLRQNISFNQIAPLSWDSPEAYSRAVEEATRAVPTTEALSAGVPAYTWSWTDQGQIHESPGGIRERYRLMNEQAANYNIWATNSNIEIENAVRLAPRKPKHISVFPEDD